MLQSCQVTGCIAACQGQGQNTPGPWTNPVSSWYLLALVGTSIKVCGIWYGALSSCEWSFLTFSSPWNWAALASTWAPHSSISSWKTYQLQKPSENDLQLHPANLTKIIACPGPIDAKEQIGPSTSVKSLGIVNQHPEVHRWPCLLLPWAKRNLMWSLVSRPFCLY